MGGKQAATQEGIVVGQATLDAMDARIETVVQAMTSLAGKFNTGMTTAVKAAIAEGLAEGTELRGAFRDGIRETIAADPSILPAKKSGAVSTAKPKVRCLGELNEAGDVVKECTSPSKDGMSLRGMFSEGVGHLALKSEKHPHTPEHDLAYYGGVGALENNEALAGSPYTTR